MSEQDRESIRTGVAMLADDLTRPLTRPEDVQPSPEVIAALQRLATGALCDLNRIADALEVLAAPAEPSS